MKVIIQIIPHVYLTEEASAFSITLSVKLIKILREMTIQYQQRNILQEIWIKEVMATI